MQATQLDRAFDTWNDAAEYLTPYAHLFRYPGEANTANEDEFTEALKLSQALYSFVLSRLPQEVHPV